jgi:hypothetical protein
MNKYKITYKYLEITDEVIVQSETIQPVLENALKHCIEDRATKIKTGQGEIEVLSIELAGSTSPIVKATLRDSSDLKELIRIFESIHKEIEDETYHQDNDNDHWVYEAAAEALYGPDYFKWFRENT